mgnify:CR=1 FL=1
MGNPFDMSCPSELLWFNIAREVRSHPELCLKNHCQECQYKEKDTETNCDPE